jgi:hypothetical protein
MLFSLIYYPWDCLVQQLPSLDMIVKFQIFNILIWVLKHFSLICNSLLECNLWYLVNKWEADLWTAVSSSKVNTLFWNMYILLLRGVIFFISLELSVYLQIVPSPLPSHILPGSLLLSLSLEGGGGFHCTQLSF